MSTLAFAERLKARRPIGMTWAEVAESTGGRISVATLHNITSGRKAEVSVNELIALAEALGVSPWELEPRLIPDPVRAVLAAEIGDLAFMLARMAEAVRSIGEIR